jgi:hypothetical protein
MIKDSAKTTAQLSLVFLAMAAFFWITGDKDLKFYFIAMALYFDLKAHLYRIQDNA